MVAVPGGYCIDSTEVTKAQYDAFLRAKAADPSGQDPWCAWNTNFVPYLWTWPTALYRFDNHPVDGIDWCDASAYCKWAGKRLCGKIGGGANPFDDFEFKTSEWYAVCSAGGTRRFPYGDEREMRRCVDGDPFEPPRGLQPVGSARCCEGGYRGIFDMIGNVDEWEDSCSGYTGPRDGCRSRGGNHTNSVTGGCGPGIEVATTRDEHPDYRGIRCCADLT